MNKKQTVLFTHLKQVNKSGKKRRRGTSGRCGEMNLGSRERKTEKEPGIYIPVDKGIPNALKIGLFYRCKLTCGAMCG